MSLSVVIATFNEEKNIQKCLDSIRDFASEIIIVDAGSVDKTVEIAKKYKTNLFRVKNNPMFHINKQFGLNKATRDWVLQLDADEVVSDELKKEISSKINSSDSFNGYFIPRKNFFLGRFMKKGGLYPDYVIRLFRKGKGKFPCKNVHEQIEVMGNLGYTQHEILHYPYRSLTEYLEKANRYTGLTAQSLRDKNTKINFINTIKYCFYLPIKTFFSIYFRHRGFIDGMHGFIWAFLSGSHYYLAYAKLANTDK